MAEKPPAPAPAPAPTPSPANATVESPPLARRDRGAERRQVTVLVAGADLFQSDAYLLDLDAEDQAKILRSFQQSCADAVKRVDGTIVQFNPDGFVACFGFPLAYEDAAIRAASSALALREAIPTLGGQFRREYRLELNLWMILHTGPAVVESSESGISLVGEAQIVAQRLREAAEPGQVICSAATHRLIQQRFLSASLGSHKLKGTTQPLELFRVESPAAVRNPIEAAEASGLTPLTGREHEISLLRDRWEKAQEGMGQVVLLIGEPGLGKSRLVYTLTQHVARRDDAGAARPASGSPSMVAAAAPGNVIEWRCLPQYQNSCLYPIREFFERLLGFGRLDASSARLDQLVGYLARFGLDRPEVAPLFASLLTLSADGRFPPLGLSPMREREETFRALREWLGACAAREPVLLVVEDLHWVDASTLEFLGQFLAEAQDERVLTVLTFRPEFQPPWPSAVQQNSLALNRLSRRQVGDLMRSITGMDVPDAVIAQVYDRTGGVPLFVEEFTKMVQQSGLLAQSGPEEARSRQLLAHAIPATLQDLVMARLDRIAGDREVAQLAATLGREFSYELLAAIADRDDAVLQTELTKLVRAEILYQKGFPPRSSYIFKHALLQDAAYSAMVKDRRRLFHQRVVDAMETRFPRTVETQPELLAHHATEAGWTEKAIGYWLAAGLRFREQSAEIEAINHLTHGLTLLQTLAESPARDTRELELRTALGTAYIAARGYAAPEVGPEFDRARTLCERVGRPSQLFAIILGNWEWHTVRGNLRHCAELAAEGMQFAEQSGDPGMMMEALFMLAETMIYRGDFAGAREHFAAAVTRHDDRERTRFWSAHTSHNAGVSCRSGLAVCLWYLGYPDQALALSRATLDLARAIAHPYSLAYALHHRAWLCYLMRIGAEVVPAAVEESAIAAAQGFALWQATGAFYHGAGLLLERQCAEAIPRLRRALEVFRGGGSVLTIPFQLSVLGEAYLEAGQFADARQAFDEGLAIAEKTDERCHEAELLRFQGELLLAEAGDLQAAEECFHRAIATARRQGSRAWELRSTVSLAQLWQRQGRRAEARAALAAVHGAYTEGFTTPDLAAARALLEALT